MAKRKTESASMGKPESAGDSPATNDERPISISDATGARTLDDATQGHAPGGLPAPDGSTTPNDAADDSARPAAADPIMDEVQAFLQRRRELAQKLRDEIELTQLRLEELRETLELLQGEMSVAEEREKKSKKPKVKSAKPSGKEGRDPRTRTLFDEAPVREGDPEPASTDDANGGEGAALPNEATVD